jgi:hypothetical protein
VHNTTVARISPTGYYCASADASGTGEPGMPIYHRSSVDLFDPVKVWDTIGEDKILKGEYRVLSGKMYVVVIVQLSADVVFHGR